MEIFYSENIDGNVCRLDADESAHCIKVLRHRCGDEIAVIDGRGTLLRCRLIDDNPRGASAEIMESIPGWGAHPYRLTMAVAPTKNADRYEWFAEKACEIGVDAIVPLIGEHSERRIFKTARVEKILKSASKQSLKAAIPPVYEPVGVREFIQNHGEDRALKLIAYCFEDETHPRRSLKEVLASLGHGGSSSPSANDSGKAEIIIMIGPEGDFSPAEAELAMACGFIPVHLGDSRLRTETAAVTAAAAVYYHFM